MKIRDYLNTQTPTGGEGGSGGEPIGSGTGGVVDTPQNQTPSGNAEPTPQANGIFANTDPNNQPPAEPQNQIVDYNFSQLEAYTGNEDYYNNLSQTFSNIGISQEQANKLVELGDSVLNPIIQHYESLLNENTPEAIDARIETEKQQLTEDEKRTAGIIDNFAKAAFADENEYNNFASLFSSREHLGLLKKFISHLNPGANENSLNGGFGGSPKGAMTMKDYQEKFDSILPNSKTPEERATKLEELNKVAKETGDKELLEYVKLL